MGQTLRAITTKCQDFCAGWDLWEGQVAGAAKVPIVSRSLLFAMGRALGAVHVEDHNLRLFAIMNPVDPES